MDGGGLDLGVGGVSVPRQGHLGCLLETGVGWVEPLEFLAGLHEKVFVVVPHEVCDFL